MIKKQSQRLAKTWALLSILLLCNCNAGGRSSTKQQQELPTPMVSATPRALEPQRALTDIRLIQPGRSIGTLQLGNTRERVYELLRRKPVDQEYTYGEPCSLTEIHWLDPDLKSNGLFIYLKEGRIFQIASAMPYYVTADGITVESSPEDVRQHYPQLQAYALLGSGTEVAGGRDLIYWVDSQNGIAFEFYFNRDTRERRVSKVIVFELGIAFKPEGCVSPPQKWQELEAFALEPLSSRTPKLRQ